MQNTNHIIISAIVAMGKNRVIGNQNQLPWHLPADLKHFKTITTGHPIIMGRKTYESIGKPLPNRTNIVVTRDPSFRAEGCIIVSSIQKAISEAEQNENKELFIIGGAEIFNASLPLIKRIYLTIIDHPFDGDVFFPELDVNWKRRSAEEHKKDEQNAYDYTFLMLERE